MYSLSLIRISKCWLQTMDRHLIIRFGLIHCFMLRNIWTGNLNSTAIFFLFVLCYLLPWGRAVQFPGWPFLVAIWFTHRSWHCWVSRRTCSSRWCHRTGSHLRRCSRIAGRSSFRSDRGRYAQLKETKTGTDPTRHFVNNNTKIPCAIYLYQL